MTKDEKLIYGKLINIYREHKYNRKETIKQIALITDKRSGERICSLKTLYNIEHNLIVKNEDIYELLFRNIDMVITHREIQIDRINAYIDKLYNSIKDYDITAMRLLRNQMPFKDMYLYVFYHEFVDCCNFLFDYYLENIMPDNLLYYMYISKVFSNKLQFLVADIIQELTLLSSVSYDIICQTDEIINRCHQSDFLYEFACAKSNYYAGYYTKALKLLQTILGNGHLSFCNELKIVSYCCLIESKIDKKYSINIMEKTLKKYLDSKEDFGSALLYETYIRLGMLSFNAKLYNKALDYFILSCNISPSNFILLVPYIYFSKEKINMPIILQDAEIQQNTKSHYYVFAHYYTLKYTGNTPKILLDYLCHEVLSALKIGFYGTGIIDIFVSEILNLSNNGNEYKSAIKVICDLTSLEYNL